MHPFYISDVVLTTDQSIKVMIRSQDDKSFSNDYVIEMNTLSELSKIHEFEKGNKEVFVVKDIEELFSKIYKCGISSSAFDFIKSAVVEKLSGVKFDNITLKYLGQAG